MKTHEVEYFSNGFFKSNSRCLSFSIGITSGIVKTCCELAAFFLDRRRYGSFYVGTICLQHCIIQILSIY